MIKFSGFSKLASLPIAAKIGISLVVGTLMSVALFSNCDRTQIGALNFDPASGNSANGIQSIAVTPTSCPAGQAAIGLSPARTLICVSMQTTPAGQTVCPAGSSIHDVDPSGSHCVTNTSWDQPGTICPIGKYVTSYTNEGAITCADPQLPGSGTCPAGTYPSGVGDGAPICVVIPSTSPSPLICPTGNVLLDVVNAHASCAVPQWSQDPTQTCPKGFFALGWLSGQLLCQQNVLPSSTGGGTNNVNFSCPAGKILLSYDPVAKSGVCESAPNPDVSHACPAGLNVEGVKQKTIVCQNAGPGGGPHCPAGQFVTGISNGQVVCAPVAANHLPGTCPDRSYPIGVSNGSLICAAFSNVQLPSPNSCVPNETRLCSIVGGVGTQTCNANGTSYSTCVATICAPGYVLDSGVCKLASCVPGTSSACPVPHGNGIQYCGTLGNWGQCQVQSCEAGYFQSGGACVPNVCTPGTIRPCSDGPAHGFQSCQYDGSGYGKCIITSCSAGYTLEGQTCRDTTAPRIIFLAVPSDPTEGRSAKIQFAIVDNESGVTGVNCFIDSMPYPACVSPVNLDGLGNGPQVFKITAIDAAGNIGSGNANWSNIVCTTGTTASCTIPNGAGQKTCQDDGKYGPCVPGSCDAGYEMKNGQCVALNCPPGYSAVGNSCVDNIAPTVKFVIPPHDPTLGSELKTEFTAEDTGSGVKSLACKLDGADLPGNPAPACASPLHLTGLKVGGHKLVITATDVAGNSGETSSEWHQYLCMPGTTKSCGIFNGQGAETCAADGSGYGVCTPVSCNKGYSSDGTKCVDITPPIVTITKAPHDPSNSPNAVVEFTATDDGSGVASTSCSLDGKPALPCNSPAAFNGLAPGEHSVAVIAVDGSGNSASKTAKWRILNCEAGSKTTCDVPNGRGEKVCKHDGSGYEECKAKTCDPNYILTGHRCVGAPCTLPWGGQIESGKSVVAYRESKPQGSCDQLGQPRTCTAGTLSGSTEYKYQTCAAGCPGFGVDGTTKWVVDGTVQVAKSCPFNETGVFDTFQKLVSRQCQSGKLVDLESKTGELVSGGTCPVYRWVVGGWGECDADCGGFQDPILVCQVNGKPVPRGEESRCGGKPPVARRICDRNPGIKKVEERTEYANSSTVCPANQIGSIIKTRTVTTTSTCREHAMVPAITYSSWTENRYCVDFKLYRCSQDALSPSQAYGRLRWMQKCSAEPRIKEFFERTKDSPWAPQNLLKNTARDLGGLFDGWGIKDPTTVGGLIWFGRLTYATFMHGDGKTPWIAPAPGTADWTVYFAQKELDLSRYTCDIPAGVYIASVCTSSCVTPDQRILVNHRTNKFQTFLDALNAKTDKVTTLTSTADFRQLSYQQTPVRQFVTELVDTKHSLLVFKMKSGGQLILTHNHPVLTEAGTMKVAAEWKTGEAMVRADGFLDPVVSIEAREYLGKVYNVMPANADPLTNIVVTEGYLNGSAFFQNEGVDFVNRVLIRGRLTKGVK